MPSAPTTDPWGWIVWGREVLHLDLSTVVPGPPSWKPLPVLVTTPLALAGGAAPALWLFVARLGALGSLLAAAHLSKRLAGPWAAAIAVAGLILCTDWLRAFAHGYTEPLAIGLLIAAADRHLCERPGQAMALAALAALTRPEALLMVAAYGVLQCRRRALTPWLVAAWVITVAALWVIPDWLGSGDPLHAGHVASLGARSGPVPALHTLAAALSIPPWPLVMTGLAGAALAVQRGDTRVAALALVVAAWVALLTAMMAVGYPARPRFFMLPAGLWCVVGAVGAVWLIESARASRLRAAAAGVALLVLPLVFIRAEHSVQEAGDASDRAQLESALVTAVDRSRPGLRSCGEAMLPARLTWMKGAVAWELGVPLRAVHAVRTPGTFGYLERLSDPDNRPLPWLSRRRAVTLAGPARGSVFLDPFANARLVAPRPERTVAADGPWRVVELGGPCIYFAPCPPPGFAWPCSHA